VEKSINRPYDVLIVEDSADDAELFLRMLQKTQFDVGIEINAQAVSNGTQADAQLEEHKFDAIFLDIEMPPPDGMELTRRIRSSELNRTTPIVIVTGAEDRGLMTRTFEAGATFFLFKPVDRMRLLRLIQISRGPMERERRRLQRVKVRCKASFESDQIRFDGETVDLSLNGTLVHAGRVLPVGTAVNMSLLLSPATAAMRMAARIVRVVGNEFIGLEFEGIGKPEREKLGAFLIPLVVAAVEGGIST
jgi:CheY-like chemotaxis protein